MAIKVGGTTIVDDSRNITGISISGLTTPLSLAQGGTAGTTAGTARTALGLVIGTDVLAPNGSAASLTSFPTFNQNTSGSAASLSATLAVASGGTGVTTSTGTTNVVLSNSPTLVTPALGTPSSGNLANCTFPTLNQNTSGSAASLSATLAIASGGTNSTATPTAGGAGYGTGSAHAYTAAGTTNQVLTSQGASAPIWTTVGSGAMTLLSTVTISNSATADVTSTFNSTYDTYMIVGKFKTTTGANPILKCQLKIDGIFQTTYYSYHTHYSSSDANTYSAVNGNGSGSSAIELTTGLAADSSYTVDIVMYLNNPTSSTEEKRVFYYGGFRSSGVNQRLIHGSGVCQTDFVRTNEALTGVRFFTATDNLVSGYLRLYGIAKT